MGVRSLMGRTFFLFERILGMGQESKTELAKAIRILYDMEMNNYLMTRGIDKLDQKIYALGHKRNFEKPTLKTQSMSGEGVMGFAGLGLFLGALIFGLVGCATGGGLFVGLGELISGAFVGGIGGAIVGGIIGYLMDIGEVSKQNKAYEEEYHRQMTTYNSQMALDNARVEKEMRIRDVLIDEKNSLIRRKKEAELKMNLFYNQVGINERYRFLIPIGYMNELLELSIADKLDGAFGLYDRVRTDLRMDFACQKLDAIYNKLDEILESQNQIRLELQAQNSKCDRLIALSEKNAKLLAENNGNLEQIKSNSEIAVYNSQRIAAEEDYQSFIMTWKG